MRPACDLAAGEHALERRLGVLVDNEPAILVVEYGIGVDLLRERVDARSAIAAKHVRERDLRVLLRDSRRIEPDRRAAVRGHDTLSLVDLVDDGLRDSVTSAERVRELVAVGVQEHRAVRAGRLRDRVPLHRARPRAAVRVVLERVEITRFRAHLDCDPCDLAGRVGMVRRELATCLGLEVAATSRREHHRRRIDVDHAVVLRLEGRGPAALARTKGDQSVVRQLGSVACLVRLAQRLRDRVAGSVTDLQESLPRGSATTCQPIPAVRTRELDAQLLEPVDRRRSLARQHLDEPRIGRLVRASHDVLGMDLRRVVLTEGSLDPALRLGGVARLQRRLGGERDGRAGSVSRDGRCQSRGAAADDEHVEGVAPWHNAAC